MTLSPSPAWAQCHIEVHEAPGWLDDCFRSALWTKFRSADSESFANANDIAGDYATMAVTEGDVVNGCGWQKDISGLALNSSNYPSLRVRLRGRGTSPQYQIEVEMSDSIVDSSGWCDAPTGFEARTLNLTLGKIVKYIRLYARSSTPLASAQIDYDYAVIQPQPPLIPHEHNEVEVELQHTIASSGFRVRCWHDILHGVTACSYTFVEGSGIKAYDRSGNRRHGTLVNSPTWIEGEIIGGLQFVGSSSQRVDTGYLPTIPASGALSICLWVKGSSGATGVLVGSGYVSGGSFNRLQLNFQSTDKIRIYVKDDAGNIRQCTSTRPVLDDTWHHVAAIVDPAGDVVTLHVDGMISGQASGTLGAITLDAYDFTIGCLHNEAGYTNHATCILDEVAFYEKALTYAEVLGKFRSDPPSGISGMSCGAWAMIYLAAEPEGLVSKLICGRILERHTGGDPDEPWIEVSGEDQSEIAHERTWSRDFTNPTQISAVAGYVVDDAVNELYRDIDATNRTIVNNFRNENAWGVLGKLAESASFATGESGAHLFVDPGGCLRFRKYGAFACPHHISDGSDGYAPNIIDIEASETIKGSPSLVNDVKVVIFEEENIPKDQDSWTESPDGWSSPDPTDFDYPLSETVDKVRGYASVKFQTTNPGPVYRMRLSLSEQDLTGFDSVKFSLKYGSGLSIDSFMFQMMKGGFGAGDYYEIPDITPQGADAWHEITINLADMSRIGNPGNIVNGLELRADHSTEIGIGGFIIDHLRFVRSEKSGSATDAASQLTYGKRSLTIIDKGITSTTYAGYVASNIVANRKNPVATIRVTVPGRGQPGYRPPQSVTVTSLKDGISSRAFQIVKARHWITPGKGYTCDLDLASAKIADSPPAYSELVSPSLNDLPTLLGEWRKRLQGEALNSLRSQWV